MVSRKVILIATIVVISLAAVGLGYAYTASTLNSGNIVNSEYVTLVQGGEGAYRFSDNINVVWDTEDKKVDTKFITEFTIQGLTPGAESDHMKDVYMSNWGSPSQS